ncbi:hypothetical protein ACQP25_24750 [Microtetraspora malaysiensis]|uniref:hypothetical protein n=1 Tax=Microtetraspora malaysiensis TaxID=161358 RepID=UPI003D8B16CE
MRLHARRRRHRCGRAQAADGLKIQHPDLAGVGTHETGATRAGAIRVGGGAKAQRGAADGVTPTSPADGWSLVRPRHGARLQHDASVTERQDSANEMASGGSGTRRGCDSGTCVSMTGRVSVSPVVPPVLPSRSLAGSGDEVGSSFAGFAVAVGIGSVGRGTPEGVTVGFGPPPEPPGLEALGEGVELGTVLFEGLWLALGLALGLGFGEEPGDSLAEGEGVAAGVSLGTGVVPVVGVTAGLGFPPSPPVGVTEGAEVGSTVGVAVGVAGSVSRVEPPDAFGVDWATVVRVSGSALFKEREVRPVAAPSELPVEEVPLLAGPDSPDVPVLLVESVLDVDDLEPVPDVPELVLDEAVSLAADRTLSEEVPPEELVSVAETSVAVSEPDARVRRTELSAVEVESPEVEAGSPGATAPGARESDPPECVGDESDAPGSAAEEPLEEPVEESAGASTGTERSTGSAPAAKGCAMSAPAVADTLTSRRFWSKPARREELRGDMGDSSF